MALLASTTLPPPLSSSVKLPSLATSPWLIPSAFSATPLIEISDDIDDLPLRTLDLVKSFDAGNSADFAFATDKPSVQWVCSAALPAPSTLPSDSSLVDTLTRESSPLSARVATAAKSGAVTPSLDSWLEALVAATGRTYLDADAYMTPGGVSASLGWHVDDVDVLLVMLRGAKRFRVAGEAVGSEVVVDRILQPGDALYIPALTFHSGGDTHSDGDDDEQPPHIQSAEREEALAAPSTPSERGDDAVCGARRDGGRQRVAYGARYGAPPAAERELQSVAVGTHGGGRVVRAADAACECSLVEVCSGGAQGLTLTVEQHRA